MLSCTMFRFYYNLILICVLVLGCTMFTLFVLAFLCNMAIKSTKWVWFSVIIIIIIIIICYFSNNTKKLLKRKQITCSLRDLSYFLLYI